MTSDKSKKAQDKTSDVKGKSLRQTSEQYVVSSPLSEQATWKQALLAILDNNSSARQELAAGEVIVEDPNGKPVAVVLDYRHYTAIVEKLEDLLDAESARDALEALNRGDENTIPWETVKADLVSDGLIDG